MTLRTLQDILPLSEQPSRYLGTEINRIRKDPGQVKLHMVLAFPDLYEIGTSHFGMQILYSILNTQKDIFAERVYAPGIDMQAHLRSAGLPLMSLETHTPLNRFAIIGFSLLYELNYTNMLTMLDLSGIPFRSGRRGDDHPLIIAGGPCMCNPEPVADLLDAVVIGDGESVILKMADAWLARHADGSAGKERLLEDWSKIDGVYVPSFFQPSVTVAGFQALTPRRAGYTTVVRAVEPDLDATPFPDKPIVPFGRPVHDRLRLEVARGCSRGCRFCQAGMIYRPVRERSVGTLLSQAEAAFGSTGYENLSLLSLSTGDHSGIVPLMERLMDRCESQRIAISLPSIRAETLTQKLMTVIQRVRKTGFTIAPEAGSRRLRAVINKNIEESDIDTAVAEAFRLGWRVIKLYFMIGLPTETDDDLIELVRLIKRLKDRHRKKGTIHAGLATFIPKPHTPFQWASQLSLAEATAKIDWIRSALKLPGVQVKWQAPPMSMLEGLWARGDRRLSELLIAAYTKGCRFDGWSDHFRYDLWTAAMTEAGVDIDFYTTRKRSLAEPLPWDHIDTRVGKLFLQKEWERAQQGESTPDCRTGTCSACGVCDFAGLKPVISPTTPADRPAPCPGAEDPDGGYRRIAVAYAKTGTGRYFGHLEMKNIFFRAIRRARIPVKFTEGFHPMPKASFEDPLPVGMQSEAEWFYLSLCDRIPLDEVSKRLNAQLPDGLRVLACRYLEAKPSQKRTATFHYRVLLKDGFFDQKAIDTFGVRTEWRVAGKAGNGQARSIDLKRVVVGLALRSSRELEMALRSDQDRTLRPAAVLAEVFRLPEAAIRRAEIIKLSR